MTDLQAGVHRRGRRWPIGEATIFLVAAIAILVAGRALLRANNVEIGDFAANGLLIQDAKSFSLWKGNYSRLGFNHPGPAILYVLAAGEVVFHDWLHVVGSPFSGQLVAVALYNAFWIAVFARLLVRVAGDRTAGWFGTVVFCLAATLVDHDVAGGAWFPHLYFFPFSVFLLAMVRTADGQGDGLGALALSAGFLVNGHVSFVVLTAAILVLVLVMNALRFRQGPAERRIVGAAFLRAHARSLAATAALFALFLVPLVVETVRAFPGPVAAYRAYGTDQDPHPFFPVLEFVGVYWGGLAAGLGAVATFAVLLRAGSTVSTTWRGQVASAAIAVLAATIALFVYGRYGVDDLKYRYVGLFYYAAPALVVALTAIAALRHVGPAPGRFAAAVLGALCLAATYAEVARAPLYRDQYDEPTVVPIYRALKTASVPGRRMVLDLDTRENFDYLWTRLVGVAAYAKRRGDDLFCIHRNWHVLFTEATKCRADELAGAPRFHLRAMKPTDVSPAPPAFESGGLRFFRRVVPDLSAAGVLTLVANPTVFEDGVLDDGWSIGEVDHAWTIGPVARLAIGLHAGYRGTATLDLDSFLPAGDSTQVVAFLVDGAFVRTVTFTQATRQQKVALPIVVREGASSVLVELRIEAPISPRRARVGDDPRPLGVSLRGIEIGPG